ncbi:tyrosine-type recombinase/integrase [Tautonia plasticadhaerens]|uniref:Site-specific tyrosine recombinase XerC n=1 Tax=Tautonia plasticadhaerens TaxID=2527974 RepID=A0A518GZJ1_9BACT|nr:site-specific integrase [Tautonia plasticadhaerens]QDV34000.1 site-specific tyrosine recombinase XerC [Tautonia plasticadhaerens]
MAPTTTDMAALPPIEQILARLVGMYGGTDPSPPIAPMQVGPSWDDFQAELLSLYDASRARSTWVKMRQALREFGQEPSVSTVRDLTPASIAGYRQRCGAEGRSPATTAGLLSYLRSASAYAVARGYLARSPFAAWRDWGTTSEPIGDDEEEGGRVRHHPLGSIARVLDHLSGHADTWKGGRLYALVGTVAYTGLRRTEALTLKRRDVDLGGRVVHVRRRRRLKRPSAAAPVPMPEALASILADWVDRAGSDWLFPRVDRLGPWLNGSTASRPIGALKAAGEEAGVPGLTFASLRHSWATHAESAWGLSELVVQRVLRHTRPATQRHYRHADLSNLAAAVRSIDFTPPAA